MPYRLRRDIAVSWLLAAAPLPTGLIMALFSERFTSHAWRYAAGIPGGYTTWAGVLIACGVLMLATMIRGDLNAPKRARNRSALIVAGMLIVGLWWFVLGMFFFAAAVTDPLASPLGMVAQWTICSFYLTWAWYERHKL